MVFLNDVKESLERVRKNTVAMVDVRSSKEFTGEILAPEYLTEHAQRGTKNIPCVRHRKEFEKVVSENTQNALYCILNGKGKKKENA
jgi:3-mercaptopyruvate sulfurtransferase SseA